MVTLVMLAYGVTATSAHAGLITIDDFTDTNATWPIEISLGNDNDGNNEAGVAGVLGGNRSTNLANGTFQSSLDRASVTIAPNVQGGVLDYNSTLFGSSTLTLAYNPDTPFDFSGQGGLVVDFIGFDFPDAGPLQINAFLTSNGQSQMTSVMVADIGSGEVFLDFADLAPFPRGVFTLADVESVVFEFVASAGSDYRIGTISTRVPSPGVLITLGIGALTTQARRRRR